MGGERVDSYLLCDILLRLSLFFEKLYSLFLTPPTPHLTVTTPPGGNRNLDGFIKEKFDLFNVYLAVKFFIPWGKC